MTKRGAFVVIEGLDKSGKSTQAAALLERLQAAKIPAQLIKFPDRTTPIGKMIDAYLRSESELEDHAVHLLFSANRWELAPTIEASLAAGTTVLCDRYAFSGIAFSAAKIRPPASQSASSTNPNASSSSDIPRSLLPYEWCRAPDVSLPAPDLTLFLDVSPETAKARGGYGSERYEQEEVQRRVRDVFERIGEEVESGGIGRWVVLDADLGKEEVERDVWGLVEPLAKDGVDRPLKRLWVDEREVDSNSHLYM